jgi:predicted RNA methylase
MADVKSEIAIAALEKYLETKSHAALVAFWRLYPRPIPSWHLSMMNDKSRNHFYENEILARAADKIVLDLGCGSGLLTQYALEAGARHVYALEQDPVLQQCFKSAFQEEIKAGRITLLQKKSQELKVEDFNAGMPQLIIHEIFGKALFNEKVIETFTDLFERNVLTPAMEILPQSFSQWACLSKQPFESKIKDPRYKVQGKVLVFRRYQFFWDTGGHYQQ